MIKEYILWLLLGMMAVTTVVSWVKEDARFHELGTKVSVKFDSLSTATREHEYVQDIEIRLNKFEIDSIMRIIQRKECLTKN